MIRVRNGDLIEFDWEILFFRIFNKVYNIGDFEKFLVRFCYYKRKVVELNLEKLKCLNKLIVVIKVRYFRGVYVISLDNMGGFEVVVYLVKGVKVMFIMNFWIDVGFCNGVLGIVIDFIYFEG